MTEANRTTPRIAVVGAGPAGLACAYRLQERGLRAVVFEKSRGYGGRVATRRRGIGQFDHGAQFLWLKDDSPLRRLAAEAGAAARWPQAADETGAIPWVGTPGMRDVLAPFAAPLDIRFSREVTALRREGDGWSIATGEDGGLFDAVALAAPAPQLLRFLDPAERALRDVLSVIAFAPCHALMVAFDGPTGWTPVERAPGGPFALLVNDSAKPGRPEGPECWVAHSTAVWSADHLEENSDSIADLLLGELVAARGPLPPVLSAVGHRWRLSSATAPLGEAFVSHADGTLLAGGDWALGPNVEHALESGTAMAEALSGSLGY